MSEKAVIMVGNKTDLVRTRAVNIAGELDIAFGFVLTYMHTP